MTLVETSAVDWLPTLKPGWTLRPLWSMFERIKDIDHPEESNDQNLWMSLGEGA